MGSLDIGIDLGTTKIIIHKAGEGVLLHEPAVVAINTRDNSVIAVGEEALRMLGRTPGYIRAEFPLRDGVISDHVMTEILLKNCIKRACDSFIMKHRVIICVPSEITDVEKRAVVEVVVNAGGRKVFLIDEPIAAAIGAGVDISKPKGNMVVDIGGGTTDIAVISMCGVVVSESIKFAGDRVDDEIIKYISSKFKLAIGKKMAEQVKKEVGNLYKPSHDIKTSVKGRNLLTCYPQLVTVSECDIHEAIEEFGEMVVEGIKKVLDQTPPELASDIIETGILLTGGTSLLKGLDKLIEERTGVRTMVADDPIGCVSRGTSGAFNYVDILQTGFTSETHI
ncbi:MAG: rod shape-determining protein [Oscillospiraceae bacterium]